MAGIRLSSHVDCWVRDSLTFNFARLLNFTDIFVSPAPKLQLPRRVTMRTLVRSDFTVRRVLLLRNLAPRGRTGLQRSCRTLSNVKGALQVQKKHVFFRSMLWKMWRFAAQTALFSTWNRSEATKKEPRLECEKYRRQKGRANVFVLVQSSYCEPGPGGPLWPT